MAPRSGGSLPVTQQGGGHDSQGEPGDSAAFTGAPRASGLTPFSPGNPESPEDASWRPLISGCGGPDTRSPPRTSSLPSVSLGFLSRDSFHRDACENFAACKLRLNKAAPRIEVSRARRDPSLGVWAPGLHMAAPTPRPEGQRPPAPRRAQGPPPRPRCRPCGAGPPARTAPDPGPGPGPGPDPAGSPPPARSALAPSPSSSAPSAPRRPALTLRPGAARRGLTGPGLDRPRPRPRPARPPPGTEPRGVPGWAAFLSRPPCGAAPTGRGGPELRGGAARRAADGPGRAVEARGLPGSVVRRAVCLRLQRA